MLIDRAKNLRSSYWLIGMLARNIKFKTRRTPTPPISFKIVSGTKFGQMIVMFNSTRCRPSKGRRCIPDRYRIKNDGSMVQTCGNLNVHVVNTYVCADLLECLWLPINVVDQKLFTKYDSRNTKVVSKHFFFKWKSIFWFPWYSTHENISNHVPNTTEGLILAKLGLFLFSGYGQTDTISESSYGNMLAHNRHPRMTGMH